MQMTDLHNAGLIVMFYLFHKTPSDNRCLQRIFDEFILPPGYIFIIYTTYIMWGCPISNGYSPLVDLIKNIIFINIFYKIKYI